MPASTERHPQARQRFFLDLAHPTCPLTQKLAAARVSQSVFLGFLHRAVAMLLHGIQRVNERNRVVNT